MEPELHRVHRECLFRARAALFGALADLGGIPTAAEEAAVADTDTAARRWAAETLVPLLAAAHPHRAPFSGLSAEGRTHWASRAPAVAAFGCLTYRELRRFGLQVTDTGAPAAARFQLAASFADWLGDECDAGPSLRQLVPVPTLQQLLREPASRSEVTTRLLAVAAPEIAEFAVLLATLGRQLDGLPRAADDVAARICTSYAAELASFRPLAAGADRVMIAREKSASPTLVIGALACAAADAAEGDRIWRATLAVGPVFGFIDDVQDLANDLLRGEVNALIPATAPLAESDVVAAMRALLKSGGIEAAAAEAEGAFRALHALHAELPGADPRGAAGALTWLRTVSWNWLA